MPRVLLRKDSQAEAELFRHTLGPSWQMLESEPEMPWPDIVVSCTAQDALIDLKKRVVLGARGLPDLLLLDLDLPGRASQTFLRELRKDPELRNLPVIAMARPDDRVIVRILDGLGVVDYYVVKSMLFLDLVTIVGRFCRQILSQTPHRGLRVVAERLPA